MKKKKTSLPFDKFKVARLTGKMAYINGGSENPETDSTYETCPITKDTLDQSSLDCLPEFPSIKGRLGNTA